MTSSGYSQTPHLIKGALIYFGAPMLIPIPNIIVFQYNPDSMTRTLTPWQPLKQVKKKFDANGGMTDEFKDYEEQRLSLAQPYDPKESFTLVLELDATDALEHPEMHPVAMLSGVADRLAAIEMLTYHPADSLLGGLLSSAAASVSASLSGGISIGESAASKVERQEVPIVLFFWGPGRIVPVRIMTLSIEEQQFLPRLYPMRAKATIGLTVLSPDDLKMADGSKANGAIVELATGCYNFTRAQKELLATANLLNASGASIIGIGPF